MVNATKGLHAVVIGMSCLTAAGGYAAPDPTCDSLIDAAWAAPNHFSGHLGKQIGEGVFEYAAAHKLGECTIVNRPETLLRCTVVASVPSREGKPVAQSADLYAFSKKALQAFEADIATCLPTKPIESIESLSGVEVHTHVWSLNVGPAIARHSRSAAVQLQTKLAEVGRTIDRDRPSMHIEFMVRPLPRPPVRLDDEELAASEAWLRALEAMSHRSSSQASGVALFSARAIAASALETHWRSMREAERSEFSAWTHALLERSLLGMFSDGPGEVLGAEAVRFSATGASGMQAAVLNGACAELGTRECSGFWVDSTWKVPRGAPQRLRTYFVRSPRDNSWHAVNAEVAGMGLLEIYRRQYAEYIKKSGTEGLRKALNDRLSGAR